ncbi:hypothetical protein B7C42_06237 [Nocardia cerradoensis]|uniref:Uncharacterized protein n=1 Tax=Nocardia cerradoensis TaxID=85688 RepID=A0A231GYC2_9NOCA|nr:hypothetical protein [Nocardia cerradoensis]OXR41596.1 hypothetical protein B7C42_06237 [Nocardia cerradoensis]
MLYFNGGLDEYGIDESTRRGIERSDALALFPRFGSTPAKPAAPLRDRVRRDVRRRIFRMAARAAGTH